jgi:hypothetical protein
MVKLLDNYISSNGFFGFGSPESKTWFVGIEPGGEHLDERIQIWGQYNDQPPIVKAKDFHRSLKVITPPKVRLDWFESDGHFQSTYGNLSLICCLVENESLENEPKTRIHSESLEFQRKRLDNEHCFLDLFAECSVNRKSSRNKIIDNPKIGERAERILTLLQYYQPRVVVFYGSEFRNIPAIYDRSAPNESTVTINCKQRRYAEGRYVFDNNGIKVLFVNHPLYEPLAYKAKVASLIRN